MSAFALQQAQDEAFETKKTVFTDLLLVVPIFLPVTGLPWGAIVHINKNQAASSIMGNIFQKPKQNSFPKAVECLQAMAAAIGVAVGTMEKLQLELTPEAKDTKGDEESELMEKLQLELTPEAKDTKGDEAIAALKAGKAVVNNQSLRLSLARSIDRGTRERKALLNNANPPRVIKTILMVMLISVNTEDMEEHLGEDLLSLPEENSEADQLLWSFVRKNINLNSRHPRYIMRLLKDSSKGFTGFHKDVDLLRKTHASVTMLMEGVTREGVKYASSQAVGLFDYVQLIHKMLDANLHLENLGGLDSEDDASDSKVLMAQNKERD
eukprot:CAMPEP_0114323302 /NCGR_PEP_ID=MMETSP0059-20121206/27784_1 /TAXON_ID=36894 /ORGANISM="Pyramimonas parkeae, Strain CCMP726" /LENGTH=323 /DNA_ID=CAMNT_0001451531 /DNA_START=13 /DNA_END=985 /DNA_ORIENTATION=+